MCVACAYTQEQQSDVLTSSFDGYMHFIGIIYGHFSLFLLAPSKQKGNGRLNCDVCPMSFSAVPPPLVPKATRQDDTSNFEPPEPSNRPALPAVYHGNRTSGFSGKELPFVGFTFTRTLASPEEMEPGKGSVVG